MDRKDTLVSTKDDKDREKLHIRNALKSCGYPKWIFDSEARPMSEKEKDNGHKEKMGRDKRNTEKK